MPEESIADQYAFRDALVDDLRSDLLGPRSADEVLRDPPITTYVVGILFPQSSDSVDPSSDNDIPDGDGDLAQDDPAVALAHVRYPSTVGLTFAVTTADSKGTLIAEIDCARYEPVESDDEAPTIPVPRRNNQREQSSVSWQRIPIHHRVELPSTESSEGARIVLEDGLVLYHRTRASLNALAVTVALVNTHRVPVGSTEKDTYAFFQPSIRVFAEQAATSPFVERPAPGMVLDDSDVRSYRLLYQHARNYAVGHGCGTEAKVSGLPTDTVETSFVPTHELRLAISNPEIQLTCLSLQFLSSKDRSEVIEALRELPAAYRQWMSQHDLSKLEHSLQITARQQLDECGHAADRMDAGIALLEADESAWRAFKLANAAMLTVRARTDWHRRGQPSEGPDLESQSWYPFQLGFFLLCIRGVVDRAHSDRSLVDLLWFPTGGGKTEAYLGLIAFTIFLRRLRLGSSGAGVTALMRYTLRLLTIQQFERAASLIAACDMIRRDAEDDLGRDPIALGLWVGGDGTPNTRAEADRQLKKMRGGTSIDRGNPVQLKKCPWCATPLDEHNYALTSDRTRIAVRCPNQDCPFTNGIPVAIVDEDVYDMHPALVIATADKFAGIAWREEAHKLFNLDLATTPPPDLIIQDELHLISGPLGTLAGLYEAAIDGACAHDGSLPKVVASTATIRRADAQTRALFARAVRQFPPSALDARDSFFSVESAPDAKGTRLYLGLLAAGTSHTTLLVRAYARLLQSAVAATGTPASRDPYWTLLGYFNSLRVLSGARMQVHNDVEDRLKLLESDESLRRVVDKVIELTSRESSSDIPGYLDALGTSLPDALDVVLATNMISVGVDVDRLGLMVVMGQPQGTAEYIQATSRVGRRYPGLVVVLLNAARSRDRSHYESFEGYHTALYRQVESSSVTPYSPRARDRALHAALVASVRLRIPAMRANPAAAQVRAHLPEIYAICDELVTRARYVAGNDDGSQVEQELRDIVERWVARATERKDLKYRDKNEHLALLIEAGDTESDEAFRTLWSLRDVDRASNMYLLR